MPAERSSTTTPPADPPTRIFTVAEANRTLVLVSRIVTDIVARSRRLIALRDEYLERSRQAGQAERLEQLQNETAHVVANLRNLERELAEVGCVLKDWWQGLVDFPAEYQGRKVWLCWRLGEQAVTHWHEWEAGFAGRQPIGPDFP